MDPSEYKAVQQQHSPGDNNPVRLTVLQAQKCAAIIQAYCDGHLLWADHLPLVVKLLQVAAVEGSVGVGTVSPTTSELWDKIRDLPWPPIGDPKVETD
jgi:hypothetical protein